MAPPPAPSERSYATAELAIAAMHEFARKHGYAMILKRSKPDKAEVKTRYFFYCDRWKTYTSTATIRQTASRASSCPFRINVWQVDEDVWDLRIEKEHNHEPSHDAASHGVYRRQDRAPQSEILR
jgi:hypothetical protein